MRHRIVKKMQRIGNEKKLKFSWNDMLHFFLDCQCPTWDKFRYDNVSADKK
jgi:hypothetical protein